MFNEAFSSILSLTKKEMTLERKNVHAAITIFASPSNYTRNLANLEEMTTMGREFVIDKKDLTADYLPIKRGDILTDSLFGRMSIVEVREMTGFKGELLGYRVRID